MFGATVTERFVNVYEFVYIAVKATSLPDRFKENPI